MFNVFLGFEQRNRYTLRDTQGLVAGYVEEEGDGLGKVLSRQLLRTRRPLRANVYDAHGTLLYRIFRPFYFITSTIYIEDAQGNVVGEVRQRWHLFKRNYDLYREKSQFGEIRGNFLAWEFEIVNEEGETLALIDRNFSGFGIELFTDAGKYVIHYGSSPSGKKHKAISENEAVDPMRPKIDSMWANSSTKVTEMSKWRTNVQVQEEGRESSIEVARPLSFSERAITLAAVISIDSDYFSRHSSSHGVGGGGGPMFCPFPWIWGGGGGIGEDAADEGAPTEGELGEEAIEEDTAGWLENGDDDDDSGGGGFFDDWGFDDIDLD